MSFYKIPSPEEDARVVLEVLKRGGIAIIPMSVGYGITAIDPDALDRIFRTKRRGPHKRHAMVGSYCLHQDIHALPPQEAGIVKLLTVDLELPLGIVAPYRLDHPIIQNLPPNLLEQSVVGETLAMLVNGGALLEELSRLAALEKLALMGSSANITGKGTKTVVEDIEPEILEVADIVIDYGRQKFHHPRASSTMIDFRTMKVVRYGACYNVVQDALWRFYGIKVPDDPGTSILSSGQTSANPIFLL
ncbi:DHBP synthase RibB-like alpha/beta domain [Penicillium camemberti]|uniref:Threonylcarbamoyl-AMP synthase n=1 Tax=Penicillium camemberti (strain FM 013) TaxID=1429867 RepID=A0A0G4PR16_PENC3|nr:DHBP synthase RibB-like alpha/beta domain [Penicillium camemberti]